jgi:mRNA interferase MazF
MASYEPGDIVTVPFPFADRQQAKRRPAVVLSSRRLSLHSNQYVLAMITTALHDRWPFDVPLRNGAAAGLSWPSIVRWKLFSLDASLIVRRIGALAPNDRRAVRQRLCEALLLSSASP